jgi:hypothetical protein
MIADFKPFSGNIQVYCKRFTADLFVETAELPNRVDGSELETKKGAGPP